jgi:hypothetical protein
MHSHSREAGFTWLWWIQGAISEKVQTNTKQIFTPLSLWHFSEVHNKVFKRSSASSLNLKRHPWPLPEVVFGTQAASFTYCLTYAGEFGGIKVLGHGGLKGYSP